jgi:hypothetical protein
VPPASPGAGPPANASPAVRHPGGPAARASEALDPLRRRALAWTPWQVGLVAGAVAVAFVLLRLLIAADGDVTRFVVAGDLFVDRTAVTEETGADLHVFPGPGYDGQFFWRLAVNPGEWGREHDGVRFDNAYRPPRIGYPVLGYLASAGQARAAAGALVAVNVGAIAAAGYAAGRIARDAGRPAVAGLLVVGAPGLVLALGRDLAECVTVACVLGGIVALRRDRLAVATGLWCLAVLTREQALVTVGAFALWRLSGLLPRRRERPGARWPATVDLVWVVPGLVYVAWQLVLWRSIGELPAGAAGGSNIVPPFSDMVPGIVGWAQGDLPRLHWVAPFQLAGTIVLLVAAVPAGRDTLRAGADADDGDEDDTGHRVDDGFFVVALGTAGLAATCLAASVWRDPSDLRHLVDVSTYAALVTVTSPRRIPWWATAAVAAVWLVTLVARIVAV